MPKVSAVVRMAQEMCRKLVGEQTRARVMMGFDAALIAANKSFNLGPSRAAKFAQDYNDAMEMLAELYISDCEDNNDKKIDYAKGKRDEIIRRIVGEENFVPFDECYGEAYVDELKRIRILNGKET